MRRLRAIGPFPAHLPGKSSTRLNRWQRTAPHARGLSCLTQPIRPMKASMISLLALATTGALSVSAQYDVPQPTPPNADRPPIVNDAAPLASLDMQLGNAVYDQRGAYASAFDEANRQVDVQVARLRA